MSTDVRRERTHKSRGVSTFSGGLGPRSFSVRLVQARLSQGARGLHQLERGLQHEFEGTQWGQ